MKRYGVLVGSFLVTFALLVSVWMVGTGRSPLGGLAATPSPAPTEVPTVAPTVQLTAAPTGTPMPTATPSPTASPSPTPTAPPLATPSPSPSALRTAPPSGEPQPSGQPGNTQTFTMTGAEFTSYQMADHARLVKDGDALTLVTTAESEDALWVTYALDPALFAAGARVLSVDADVCGQGSGVFWEAYGPVGSTPDEYEVVPPDADGCWHFTNAATDEISVIVSTMLDSQMTIDQVVFRVTFAN
jgi:hypothetical protein